MLIFKDYVVNQNLGGPLKGLLLLCKIKQTNPPVQALWKTIFLNWRVFLDEKGKIT
jgi:hypothetical protein